MTAAKSRPDALPLRQAVHQAPVVAPTSGHLHVWSGTGPVVLPVWTAFGSCATCGAAVLASQEELHDRFHRRQGHV